MSLIWDCKEINKRMAELARKAEIQQGIYFILIKGMVKLHQEHRIAKNYAVSDEMRILLNSVGIRIIQGTAGYKYEDIPESLKGKPVQDTWEFKSE